MKEENLNILSILAKENLKIIGFAWLYVFKIFA